MGRGKRGEGYTLPLGIGINRTVHSFATLTHSLLRERVYCGLVVGYIYLWGTFPVQSYFDKGLLIGVYVGMGIASGIGENGSY